MNRRFVYLTTLSQLNENREYDLSRHQNMLQNRDRHQSKVTDMGIAKG